MNDKVFMAFGSICNAMSSNPDIEESDIQWAWDEAKRIIADYEESRKPKPIEEITNIGATAEKVVKNWKRPKEEHMTDANKMSAVDYTQEELQ